MFFNYIPLSSKEYMWSTRSPGRPVAESQTEKTFKIPLLGKKGTSSTEDGRHTHPHSPLYVEYTNRNALKLVADKTILLFKVEKCIRAPRL